MLFFEATNINKKIKSHKRVNSYLVQVITFFNFAIFSLLNNVCLIALYSHPREFSTLICSKSVCPFFLSSSLPHVNFWTTKFTQEVIKPEDKHLFIRWLVDFPINIAWVFFYAANRNLQLSHFCIKKSFKKLQSRRPSTIRHKKHF